MADDTIKEFLVGLGFKIDEAGQRRFTDSIGAATVGVMKLAAAITGAATAALVATNQIARHFESVYFSAQNLGTSVKNLEAFKYAMSQVGSSAEEAMGAITGFKDKLNTLGPGQMTWLKTFGVKEGDDPVKQMIDFVNSDRFKNAPIELKKQYATMAGISENAWRAMLRDVTKFTKEYEEKIRKIGLDSEEAARQSVRFREAWNSAWLSIEAIIKRVGAKFGDEWTDRIKKFTAWLDSHGDEIANDLNKIGKDLLWIMDILIDFGSRIGNWIKYSGDPWLKNVFGINRGFERMIELLVLLYVTHLGALAAAILGLVKSTGWTMLMGGLLALGLPGAAIGLGILLAGAGARALAPGGEDIEGEGYGAHLSGGKTMGGYMWDKAKRIWHWVTGGGGGGGEGASIGGRPAAGALAKNQQIAYEAARAEGYSDEAAKRIVANLSGESLRNPADKHWDVSHYSQGIASWDPPRSAAIKAQFGKEPMEMTIPEQMKALAWEIRTNKRFAPTKSALEGNVGEEMKRALVHNFEVSGNQPRDIAMREGFYKGLRVNTPDSMIAKAGAMHVPNFSNFNMSAQAATPIGHNTSHHFNPITQNVESKPYFVINAAKDPGATADHIASMQDKQWSGILRDLQGAAK